MWLSTRATKRTLWHDSMFFFLPSLLSLSKYAFFMGEIDLILKDIESYLYRK